MQLFLNLVLLLTIHGGSNSFELKDCDLLFQDLDCGPLCEAIEEVIEGIGGAKFSHVGMVMVEDSGIYVLEAISEGVMLTPFSDFMARSHDEKGNPKVVVGRLKEEFSAFIPEIKLNAANYLGAEYDRVYLMDNEAYYCSELLYLCFSDASGDKDFFKIEAMTFKSKQSNSFFPAWKSYYSNLETNIPEGQPGLNPGGISRSEKIDIVHQYGKPRGYNPSIEH